MASIRTGLTLGGISRQELRLDDLNRIRVIDEETEAHAGGLKEVCNEFLRDTGDFRKISDGFIKIFDSLGEAVEKEKLAAIGARNLLKTVAKQRSAQQQQLTALIREKQQQHERLQQQYASLLRVEQQQRDFLDQFVLQK